MKTEQLDPLKKVEDLTLKANDAFGKKGKSVFERYPLMFALLVIFGATMMSQGVKEIILEVPFFQTNPLLMFLIGVFILIATGTLYKKLEK